MIVSALPLSIIVAFLVLYMVDDYVIYALAMVNECGILWFCYRQYLFGTIALSTV